MGEQERLDAIVFSRSGYEQSGNASIRTAFSMRSSACVTGVTGKAGGLFRVRLWRSAGEGMLILASLSA